MEGGMRPVQWSASVVPKLRVVLVGYRLRCRPAEATATCISDTIALGLKRH